MADQTVKKPTKLDDLVIKKLSDAMRLGATKGLACKYAGISRQQLHRWIKSAELDGADPILRRLVDALDYAEGQRAVVWLAKIEKAADDSWQAAAWLLERIYPTLYGKNHMPEDVPNKVILVPTKQTSLDEWVAAHGPGTPESGVEKRA